MTSPPPNTTGPTREELLDLLTEAVAALQPHVSHAQYDLTCRLADEPDAEKRTARAQAEAPSNALDEALIKRIRRALQE